VHRFSILQRDNPQVSRPSLVFPLYSTPEADATVSLYFTPDWNCDHRFTPRALNVRTLA
jgi:hypothetical protein